MLLLQFMSAREKVTSCLATTVMKISLRLLRITSETYFRAK